MYLGLESGYLFLEDPQDGSFSPDFTSFDWIVADVPYDQATVLVFGETETSCWPWDASDGTFEITKNFKPRLTTPNGGEYWLVGDVERIEWVFDGSPPSQLSVTFYRKSAGGTWTPFYASGPAGNNGDTYFIEWSVTAPVGAASCARSETGSDGDRCSGVRDVRRCHPTSDPRSPCEAAEGTEVLALLLPAHVGGVRVAEVRLPRKPRDGFSALP